MDWELIYDREAPVLLSYLISRGASFSQAEDVIQEVFMAALKARAQPDKPRAYLFTAARRKMAEFSPLTTISEIPEIIVEQTDQYDVEKINRVLHELPIEQREIVVLHIWHGMKLREIAESLDESLNTVSSRWRYALEKLRVSLKGVFES